MDAKTLCLGALRMGPASGYEIRKLFEEGPFSHFHQVGFGSIYPALGMLLAEGKVRCEEAAQDGRPDKKVYHLTEAGLRAFDAALMKRPAPDLIRSDVLFMLFFAERLPPERVDALINAYAEAFRRSLSVLDMPPDCVIPPGRRFVRGFGRAIYRAALDYIADHRHLLERTEETPERESCAQSPNDRLERTP